MPSLPILSGRAVAKAFGRGGWELVRQKGSHMILVKDGSWATLSVPDHKQVAPGTMRSLIRAAGMTVDEFFALTKK